MNSDDSAIRLAKNQAFGMTDVGQKRNTNQDQFLIAQLNKSMLVTSTSLPLNQQSRLFGGIQGQVFLVADGMGGHAAGEKASSLAVDDLVSQLLNSVHWFFQSDQDREDEFIDNLRGLLRKAHQRILEESSSRAEHRGMGTTLTMAHVVWPRLYVVHAGDSRCYLIRDGVCEQLTTDHTLARRLVESGGLDPAEEASSRWSNVLWNVLGGKNEDGDLIAEVSRTDLRAGDAILLCSDGLYRHLSCDDLAVEVGSSADLPTVCSRLIDRANQAGGEDNITVVVARPTPTYGRSERATVQTEVPLDNLLAGADSDLTDTVDEPVGRTISQPRPGGAASSQTRGDTGSCSPRPQDDAGSADDGMADTLPG